MWSCDRSMVTLAFLWENLSQRQVYEDLTRKTALFEGWSWLKFNNLGLTLGMSLKFYTSVAKWLKLKVRQLLGIISTFVEIIWEKLVGGLFGSPTSWIGLKLESKSLKHNKKNLSEHVWMTTFPWSYSLVVL